MPEKTNGTASTKTSSLPAAEPSVTDDSEGKPKPDGARQRRRRSASKPTEGNGAEGEENAGSEAPEPEPTPPKKKRKSRKSKTTEVASPLELIGMLTLESVRTGIPIEDLVDRYEAACAAFRKATS